MPGMNRREFLGGASAIVLIHAFPDLASSQENPYRFLSSPLKTEHIEARKKAAIESLVKSIPLVKEANYLRENARNHNQESQMYIPNAKELTDVVQKSVPQLNELTSTLQVGAKGLFAFADSPQGEKRFQRMYVVERKSDNELQFLNAYHISMAQKGFGNEPESEQTPLGIHTVLNGTRGMFGEVVSGLNKYRDMFNHIRVGKKDHWFVKGFGREGEGNDIAEVVTDQYLLTGPNTPASRGIRIHGTNRSGELEKSGSWRSFLGGLRRSGGCLRMGNTDARDLGLQGILKPGTVVMVHATEEARADVAKAPIPWDPSKEIQVDARPITDVLPPEVRPRTRPPTPWTPPE